MSLCKLFKVARMTTKGFVLTVVAQILGIYEFFTFLNKNIHRFVTGDNILFLEDKYRSENKIMQWIDVFKIANSIAPPAGKPESNHAMLVVSMKLNFYFFTFILIDPVYEETFILELPPKPGMTKMSIKAMSIGSHKKMLVSMNNPETGQRSAHLFNPIEGSYDAMPVIEQTRGHFVTVNGYLVQIVPIWDSNENDIVIKLVVHRMFTTNLARYYISDWEKEWIHYEVASVSSFVIHSDFVH